MEFLNYLAKRFELIVFCKGSELYCKPVLDFLESKAEYFSQRLYGNYVLFENQNFSVKYYDFLLTHGRTLANTIIVDCGVEPYCLNLCNGVPILSFTDEHDIELIHVAKYLDEQSNVKNIGETLRESLNKCGIIVC